MEVVHTGPHRTPRQIVATALQEDPDGIGLPVLSGARMTLFAEVLRLLRKEGAEDIVVFGGGIIPADGIPELLDLGVAGIFTPGAPPRAITGWVHAGMGRPVAARRVTGRTAPGSPHRWRRGKEGGRTAPGG